jgi:hypothetical protein
VSGGSGSVLEGENVALTRSTVVDMFLDPSRRQDQAHPVPDHRGRLAADRVAAEAEADEADYRNPGAEEPRLRAIKRR